MANNRLFIKCDKCGDRMLIMKYYPYGLGDPDLSNWGWQWYPARTMNEFYGWPNEHTHGDISFIGPTHFSLEYEDTDE